MRSASVHNSDTSNYSNTAGGERIEAWPPADESRNIIIPPDRSAERANRIQGTSHCPFKFSI